MDSDAPSTPVSRPFLNTRQAGFYLGLSARHLERLRAQGKGPVYRRHSRFVVYHVDDLAAWSVAHSSASQNPSGSGDA